MNNSGNTLADTGRRRAARAVQHGREQQQHNQRDGDPLFLSDCSLAREVHAVAREDLGSAYAAVGEAQNVLPAQSVLSDSAFWREFCAHIDDWDDGWVIVMPDQRVSGGWVMVNEFTPAAAAVDSSPRG
eukprot:TRINITY_DN1852_c1_g1_i7.p1 TRINITY_DN1852_c1_g1~~TRINITY_DN1852_c1_g1_i7.p1  ORF type:complete len:129 (+),score=34.66 TRINITY_DN1852_c1_g1_i7:79-465(+)